MTNAAVKPEPGAVNLELLPESLRELVRALGEASAFDLVQALGGGRITVPTRARANHPLFQVLGGPMFVALVEAYAGLTLELPKYDSVMRQLRHERVRQHRAQGLTMDQVAVATGYSRRQVINILGRDGVDDGQMAMFAEAGEGSPVVKKHLAHDPFGLAR